MTELEKFIEEMKEKYGDSVIVQKGACDKEILKRVPEPLKEFYSEYESTEFPFGRIYPATIALEESIKTEPFNSERWFWFGFDGYFSFWLCSFQPDKEGLWITPYDHEADCERECVYASLIDFLKDIEEEYEVGL
ncbi:MAG: hypothetical protein NC245_01470 [Muribaculum sp.]|nr:hypothetical protein [Muribaculum sp.]